MGPCESSSVHQASVHGMSDAWSVQGPTRGLGILLFSALCGPHVVFSLQYLRYFSRYSIDLDWFTWMPVGFFLRNTIRFRRSSSHLCRNLLLSLLVCALPSCIWDFQEKCPQPQWVFSGFIHLTAIKQCRRLIFVISAVFVYYSG